ncbi:MAG: PIG-L deacetylase family protein [Acidobacteriota bacterium]
MKFQSSKADFFVPDGLEEISALSRTTHLCIGAHQDDIEIMAYHGIAECFRRSDRWMSGVIVTDGSGSARTGIYGNYSDEQMQEVRQQEQRKAAVIGEYAAQVQLAYPSSIVKDSNQTQVVDDLLSILATAKPEVLYLHNPADKHDTHIAVLARSLAALRRLSAEERPRQVYGCEVWRDLDWLVDEAKEVLPVSAYPNMATALVGVFDSQISGGKRYDLATSGRRLANATYFASHATDQESALTFALDLTPLIRDDQLSLSDFTLRLIDRFKDDVESRIQRLS